MTSIFRKGYLKEENVISELECMHFKDINRCRYFADRIEDNEAKVTGYCKPVLVSQTTTFRD